MRGMRALAGLAFLWLAPALEAVIRIEGPFPARDGETCIVCNGRVSVEDLAFVINGQRVAVMRGMEDALLGKPERYVQNLQPKGLVSAREANGGGSVYLYAGVFVLVGLVFGGLCAHMAMLKGLKPWRWFALGFLFSLPAFAVVASRQKPEDAAEMPGGLEKVHATREPVPCPGCSGTNHPAAAKCLHCGAALTPSATSEVAAI
jgi:hypothetical protein